MMYKTSAIKFKLDFEFNSETQVSLYIELSIKLTGILPKSEFNI